MIGNSRTKTYLKDMAKIFRDPILLITIIIVTIILLTFIIYPLFSVLNKSFIRNGRFTLDSYIRIFNTLEFRITLKNTLVLGFVVGILSTIIGFIFAYANVYLDTGLRKLFDMVSILPIVSPPFVLGLSAILLFGQQGIITKRLLGIQNANIYGFKGLVMVQVMTFFPVAYLVLRGLLLNMDPALEEASRNMGASTFQTFLRVTLPLMTPGIANAFLLTFIETVADFANPMLIGGNYSTLATHIYMQAISNYDMEGGATIAVILLSLSILLFVIEKYFVEKRSYITVTGKSPKKRGLITEQKIVLPIKIICIFVTVFVMSFYILVPIGALFKTWGMDFSLTLNHFKYVFNVGLKPFVDTIYLSAIATPITGIISMIIAFLTQRKQFIGRSFIEFTSLLAMAVPGTVLGIGYILAYNTKPLLLTGTATILIIAFVMRSLPVGVRSGVASLAQIDPAIEEAAQDLGANTFQVFSTITLPLIKPAFFSSLVYAFVRSMTAVSAVVFLISARYNMLTTQIMAQADAGRFGVACAYSTILIAVVFAAVYFLNYLLSKMGVERQEIV